MSRVLGRTRALAAVMVWSLDVAAQAPPAASFPTETPAPANAAPATPAPTTAPPPAAAPPAAAPPAAAPPAAAPAAIGAPPSPPVEPPLPLEPSDRKKPTRYVSLTISPLHLLAPVLELQVEGMLTPHFGVAAIGGVGSIKAESNDPAIEGEKFTAYELGLQLTGYPLQDFSSLQLGAELLWIKVSTENFAGREISANAGGVALGPFIGYKLITEGGFTFFVQGGFQYVAVKAEASDSQGNTAEDEQDTIIPLLNLNLGWSF